MLEHHDIICLASSSYYARSWLNVQHIMNRLAGPNRVLYVESIGLRGARLSRGGDLGRLLARLKLFLTGLKRPKPGLAVLSPAAFPFARTARVERWNRKLLIRQIRRAARRLDFSDAILWTFLPVDPDITSAFHPRLLVYHCVDEYAANPGVDASAIQQRERRLLAEADLVFTTSRPLFESKSPMNPNTHCVPNVADVSLFEPSTPAHPSFEELPPGPRIGYVGNIAQYKIDLDLLDDLARTHPEWRFVLVGPVAMGDPDTSTEALKSRDNVTFTGEVERTEVPGYVAGFDVCLMPLRFSEYTRHSFPMKFHEFLAMGKPVVASDVDPLADFRELFYPCREPADFEKAIALALAETGDKAQARIEVARKNSWSERMEEISDAVGTALDRCEAAGA